MDKPQLNVQAGINPHRMELKEADNRDAGGDCRSVSTEAINIVISETTSRPKCHIGGANQHGTVASAPTKSKPPISKKPKGDRLSTLTTETGDSSRVDQGTTTTTTAMSVTTTAARPAVAPKPKTSSNCNANVSTKSGEEGPGIGRKPSDVKSGAWAPPIIVVPKPNGVVAAASAPGAPKTTAASPKQVEPRNAQNAKPETTFICVHHLHGQCLYGSDCGQMHTTTGLPFHWQYYFDSRTNGTAAGDGDGAVHKWMDVGMEACLTLERSYCNVANDGCTARVAAANEPVYIRFDQMTFSGQGGLFGRMRRLFTSTFINQAAKKSSSTAESSNRRFGTAWKWYWKHSLACGVSHAADWNVCEASDDIEQEFTSNELGSYRQTGQSRSIDFGRMVLLDYIGNIVGAVRRRPATMFQVIPLPTLLLPAMKSSESTSGSAVPKVASTAAKQQQKPAVTESKQVPVAADVTRQLSQIIPNNSLAITRPTSTAAAKSGTAAAATIRQRHLARINSLYLTRPTLTAAAKSVVPASVTAATVPAPQRQLARIDDSMVTRRTLTTAATPSIIAEDERAAAQSNARSCNTVGQSKLPTELTPLESTSSEYSGACMKFRTTLPNIAVKSVQSVANDDLWDDFCRLRARMEAKRGAAVDIRLLFHGTQPQYVDAIIHQGFDCRLAGMTAGTKFGKGSYFARDARYSLNYCGGGRRMFLCWVIVGDYCQGQKDYTRPPAKDRSLPLHVQQLYDSCVDRMDDPSICVVFQNNQAYPAYVVNF